MSVEIFVHGGGRDAVVGAAEEGEVLATVLERLGFGPGDLADAVIFVGESEGVLTDFESDEAEDATEPVDSKRTLSELGLGKHGHVHVSKCKKVKVDVHYGAKTKRRTVAPSTTIETLTKWARKAFRLDAASASEYVLQINGTKVQPRPDVHVGELTSAPTCAVSFDLIKEVTPQG